MLLFFTCEPERTAGKSSLAKSGESSELGCPFGELHVILIVVVSRESRKLPNTIANCDAPARPLPVMSHARVIIRQQSDTDVNPNC